MKKLTAILLLTLFVFNTIGYRLWIDYAQVKADTALEARLDAGGYNDDELLTVKIPLNLPYQVNWKEFERVDGEMDVNGTVYKYVKRKVLNDTLILLCISHEEKMQIEKKANDYFGKVNDLPGNDHKTAEIYKQLSADYDVNEVPEHAIINNPKSGYNLQTDVALLFCFIPFPAKPPQVIA